MMTWTLETDGLVMMSLGDMAMCLCTKGAVMGRGRHRLMVAAAIGRAHSVLRRSASYAGIISYLSSCSTRVS